MTTEEKLRTIVSDQLMVDASEVTTNSNFEEDLGADSLDVVELVMRVEEKFDLDFDYDDTDKLKTFGELVEFVTAKIN